MESIFELQKNKILICEIAFIAIYVVCSKMTTQPVPSRHESSVGTDIAEDLIQPTRISTNL